jgi:hypothetical protein
MTNGNTTPSNSQPSGLTGDVIVTINATSATEAASLAGSIPGFTIDASQPVLDWGNGQYTVVGNAAQPIIVSGDVVAVDGNEQIQLGGPDS